MALAHFNKVALIGLRDQREPLLKVLQDAGLLEITAVTPETEAAVPGGEGTGAGLQKELARVEQRLAEVSRGLAFVERITPVKPNIVQQFAGIKTYLSPREFGRILKQEERLRPLLDELFQAEQELNQLQTQKTQLNTLADHLAPWREMDLPYADLQGSSRVRIFLGSANQPLTELKTGIQELERPFYLEAVSEAGQTTLFVLMAPVEEFELFQAVLVRMGVAQTLLPTFKGTVRDQLEALERERIALAKAESAIRERVALLAKERVVLEVFYDALFNERRRLELAAQLTHSERSLLISGWIMTEKRAQLEELLSQAQLNCVVLPAEPEEGEQPPTVLQNNPWSSPFEYLVQSFSYPRVHEIDPTASIAPFFFLFFGIALGDAGYGLMLAIICGLLLVKLKLGPVGRKLSWMFLFSGVGAILFGLVTGSVFSLENLQFGLFNPLKEPILLLLIALGLGLVQLYYGILISAAYSVREGRWLDAVWNQGTLLFFLTSVILVLSKDAIGLTPYSDFLGYMLAGAALLMVIGNTYGKKGILAKLIAIPGGLYNIYNTIGFFSDVLSYSRLMALGLSGGVMGGIMNQLAGMVFNSIPVLGWILGAAIFLFGHALNFALCVLGAYVHSSRLQYLEFFSKFFEGGGRPFTPFGKKPKYTFLVDEREA